MTSRRAFIYSTLGVGGAALVNTYPARAAGDPRPYLDATSVSANTLANQGANQAVDIGTLYQHYFGSTNLFLFIAANNLNPVLPDLVNYALDSDPGVLFRLDGILSTVQAQTGIAYHPALINQAYTPSASDVKQTMGSNFGYVQSTFADALTSVLNGTASPVSYRKRDSIYAQQLRIRRAITYGLPPRLVRVEDKPGLGTLLTSAGVLIGAGSAMVSLSGTSLAAVTTVTLSAGIVFTLGAGLIFAGAALGAYGVYTSLQAMYPVGSPSDGNPSGDLPCYHEIPPCPRND